MRWVAIGVFILSSFLNYFDRQLLSAAAPIIKQEFSLNNEQYGWLLLAFSIAYGASAIFVGWWLDRVGLNVGISIAVGAWSLVGVATGFAGTFAMLLACRAALGLAEAGSIPGFGKANALYLRPSELALGTGLNQVGLSIAGMAAPFLVGRYAAEFGWRSIYIWAGLIGLLWLPLWWWTSRAIPPPNQIPQADGPTAQRRDLLRERGFWGLVLANVLYMTLYTLWTNWTTIYFTTEFGMPQAEANTRFAWIPPIFATLGGLTGGAFAFVMIRRGTEVFRSRMTVSWVSSGLTLLTTALIPWMPTPGWAVVLICASSFCVIAMSANVYAMPIDFWGPGRAGFGVAALTAAYGLMQAVVSPAIGIAIDRTGFAPVCMGLAVLPLAACLVLQRTAPRGG